MKAIFITVRTDSSRLPEKCLIEIDGKKTIEILIERLKRSLKYDKIVMCTTEREVDDRLCEIAKRLGIYTFRGSTEDKLDRWNKACDFYGVDFFVTADGDDLFCEPLLIDTAFEQSEDEKIDFIKCDGIVWGAFTYGIRASALRKVCELKGSSDTEMMWVYFTETGVFNVAQLNPVDLKYMRTDIRMTLDYQDDLKFFSAVINHFKDRENQFTLDDIIDLIDKNPNLKEINYHCQDEWKKNQEIKTNLVLR